MAINFSYYDSNPTTLPFPGLYVPVIDLPGMEPSELAMGVATQVKEGKVVYSLLQKIHSTLSVSANTLGMATSVANPVVINPTTVTLTYGLTVDYLTNVSSGDITMIPVPTTGVFTGLGAVSLRSVFPNCIAANTLTDIESAGAGVLISTADLAIYGFFNDVNGSTLATINLTGDNRYAISSIFQCIADGNVSVRTTSTASGITSVVVSAATIREIPTTYYASVNPLSGLSATSLDHVSLTRRTYSVTLELNLLPEYLEVSTVTL